MSAARATLPMLTEEELVIELAGLARGYGRQQQLAGQLGISQGSLANILGGDRGIGERLAERLGYRRRVLFEPVE